jgi:hypothetical protein
MDVSVMPMCRRPGSAARLTNCTGGSPKTAEEFDSQPVHHVVLQPGTPVIAVLAIR